MFFLIIMLLIFIFSLVLRYDTRPIGAYVEVHCERSWAPVARWSPVRELDTRTAVVRTVVTGNRETNFWSNARYFKFLFENSPDPPLYFDLLLNIGNGSYPFLSQEKVSSFRLILCCWWMIYCPSIYLKEMSQVSTF